MSRAQAIVALVDARGDRWSAPSTRRRPTTAATRSLPQSGRSSARKSMGPPRPLAHPRLAHDPARGRRREPACGGDSHAGGQRQARTDWSASPWSPAVTTGSHGRGMEPRIRTFVAELLKFRLAGRPWVGTQQENPRAGCKPRRGPRDGVSPSAGRSVQRVSEPAPDISARTAARPASSRATGTRGGEQET